MKFKPDLKIILATFLMALVMLPVMGQERQVTGTVFEPDGVNPYIRGYRCAQGHHHRHEY
jgi:hypothetical protein